MIQSNGSPALSTIAAECPASGSIAISSMVPITGSANGRVPSLARSSRAWMSKPRIATRTHGCWTVFWEQSQALHRRNWLLSARAMDSTPTSFTWIAALSGASAPEKFIAAMNAEGIPNQASYPPLHALDVFKSGEYRRKLTGRQAEEPHPFLKRDFPETHRAAWETVWIPQPVLLGDEQDMHEIATALKKIQNHAGDLGTASVPVRETA